MATFKSSNGRGKQEKLPSQMIWRMSDQAPQGKWVDLSAKTEVVAPSTAELPEVSTRGGWLTSSFDLLNGMDMTEDADTVPGEIFDELFLSAGGDLKASKR